MFILSHPCVNVKEKFNFRHFFFVLLCCFFNLFLLFFFLFNYIKVFVFFFFFWLFSRLSNIRVSYCLSDLILFH